MSWFFCIGVIDFICMVLSIFLAIYSTSSITRGIFIFMTIWSAICTAWTMSKSGFFDKKGR